MGDTKYNFLSRLLYDFFRKKLLKILEFPERSLKNVSRRVSTETLLVRTLHYYLLQGKQ